MTTYNVNKKRQTMILVRGIQGSGKSTFAESLKKFGFVHHENDKFFTDENGIYTFDLSKHQLAKDKTLDMVLEDLKLGKSVVVSNTFNSLKELNQYKELAENMGIDVKIVKMNLNFKSVHSVPEEIVEKARKTYEPHEKEKIISDPKYVILSEKLKNKMKP